MNVSDLVNEFQQKYEKNNYILNAMLYSLQSIDNIENKIIYLVKNVESNLNKHFNKNYDLSSIIKSMIYLYNSQRIIFNLPHMLCKTIDKNKPSLHIIYGEMLVQLTSITLFSEALNVLNNFDNIDISIELRNKLKLENIKLLNHDNLDFNINLLENDSNFKCLLKKEYEKNIKKLYDKTINICLNFYQIKYEDLKNLNINLNLR